MDGNNRAVDILVAGHCQGEAGERVFLFCGVIYVGGELRLCLEAAVSRDSRFISATVWLGGPVCVCVCVCTPYMCLYPLPGILDR